MENEVKAGNATGSTGAAGSGSGGTQYEGIPEELHNFVNPETKQVDYSKVAKSIREANQKISDTSREKAATEAAYRELAGRVGGGAAEGAVGGERKSGRKISIEDIASDPETAVRGVATDTFASLAQPVVDAVIAATHPEVAQVGIDDAGNPTFRDPEFVKGLQVFAKTLPAPLRNSLGDYNTANYVITLYKQLRTAKTGAEQNAAGSGGSKGGGNFSESGKGPSRGAATGKTWKRSEIRDMIARRPDEYARRQDEIQAAYSEERVDLEH